MGRRNRKIQWLPFLKSIFGVLTEGWGLNRKQETYKLSRLAKVWSAIVWAPSLSGKAPDEL